MADTTSELSEVQIAEYKECFKMFDINGDGTISADELATVLRTMGQNPNDKDVQQMMDKADLDKNKKIDFTEFLELMKGRWTDRETRKNDLKAAFEVFDKDKSGKISFNELKAALTNLGEKMSDDDVREMIKGADIDGDGHVSYEEFVEMMSD